MCALCIGMWHTISHVPVHFHAMPDIPFVGVAQDCAFEVRCIPCPMADGLKGNICQAQNKWALMAHLCHSVLDL